MSPSLGHTISRRQFVQAMAAALPTASLLAACGNSTSSGPVKLRMSDWWGGQFPQYLPLMKKKTGMQMSESGAPSPNYEQKLLTQLVSGTAPDIFLLDAPANGDIFSRNLVAPFDDYLKSSGVDMSKWNIPPSKEVGYKGKTMGLSLFTMQDMIVHVNHDLADKAGVLKDAPLWGTPTFDTWKWPRFVEWLKAGTRINSNGTVEQFGLGADVGTMFAVLRAMIADNGGHIFDDDWNYNETRSMIDQDPVIEAAQLLVDLVRTHKVAPAPDAESGIQGGTYRAKRAMATITWSTPSIFPESSTFQQDHFHLPYVQNKVHAVGANELCVSKGTKQQEAAFKWITTFCVDKDVRTQFLQVSSVPAYDPLPIVNASPAGTPKTIALINLSRITGMSPIPANAQGVVLYSRSYGRKAATFTTTTMQSALEAALLGKQSVKDAFTQAKQKIDAELARNH